MTLVIIITYYQTYVLHCNDCTTLYEVGENAACAFTGVQRRQIVNQEREQLGRRTVQTGLKMMDSTADTNSTRSVQTAHGRWTVQTGQGRRTVQSGLK